MECGGAFSGDVIVGTVAVFTIKPTGTMDTVPVLKSLGLQKLAPANFTRPAPGGVVRGTPAWSVYTGKFGMDLPMWHNIKSPDLITAGTYTRS